MECMMGYILTINSCPHKEEQEGEQHQVQGQVPAVHLHARPQGYRQGREAEAESASRYGPQINASHNIQFEKTTMDDQMLTVRTRAHHLRRRKEEPQGQARIINDRSFKKKETMA